MQKSIPPKLANNGVVCSMCRHIRELELDNGTGAHICTRYPPQCVGGPCARPGPAGGVPIAWDQQQPTIIAPANQWCGEFAAMPAAIQ
jgi:hypothetical protein